MTARARQKTAARRAFVGALIFSGAFALSACDPSRGGSVDMARTQIPIPGELAAGLPVGDVAGGMTSNLPPAIANPFHGDQQAIAQGRNLYVRMNCAGCHGYAGEGGIGPSLADGWWRYGGTPGAIFQSLYVGRSEGMPAWNPAMPPTELWKIVAYIESLGGTYASTDRQASIQGDRPGDVVPATVKPTIAPDAPGPIREATSAANASSAAVASQALRHSAMEQRP